MPDVVLMDLMMPKMDGAETTAALERLAAHGEGVAVLAIPRPMKAELYGSKWQV